MINESQGVTSDKPQKDLYRRAVKGGFWVIALRIVVQVLAVVRLLVLADVLGATKWGLLAIAMLTVSIVNIFTQTGFRNALIQNQDDTRRYLDTAWTVGLVRGFTIYAILFFAAPYAAVFFDGSGQFKRHHLVKPAELILELRQGQAPLSRYIVQNFSAGLQQSLDQYESGDDNTEEITTMLVDELNLLISSQDIYSPERFAHVRLSKYTQGLLEGEQQKDMPKVNRRLLQDAYPDNISETVLDLVTTAMLIRMLGLVFIFGSLANIGTVYFRKELQYNKRFYLTASSSLAQIALTITLAYLMRSVWALVWGKLLGASLGCAFGYIFHPYRPRLSFDRAKAAKMWRFGRWIFLAGILAFFLTQGDDLFVGKFLGPAMLGLYLMGYKLSQVPATEITVVISEVTFPVYSKLQGDIPRLKDAYLKILQFTAFLTVPLAGMIFVFAPDFVTLFMKAEWQPIIPVMQILAVKGLLHSLHATIGPIYHATGKPWISIPIKIARLIMLVSLIYPLTARWGIVGTSVAVLAIALVIQPVGYCIVMKILHCRLRDILRQIVFPLGATLVMLAAIALVRQTLFTRYSYGAFFTLACSGAGCYLAVIYACERFFGYSIRQVIIEIISNVMAKKPAPTLQKTQ